MKIKRLCSSLLTLMSGLFLVGNCPAQDGIHWFTIDGGGGFSTGSSAGGTFAVVGTFGQADAGPVMMGKSSGVEYRLTGGFWSFLSGIPDSPRPTLKIQRDGIQVIVAWANPSTGFELEEATAWNGQGTLWSKVNQNPIVAGSEKQVNLPATGVRFYRLKRP